MNTDALVETLKDAGVTLALLEANGRIDALDGIEKDRGWYALWEGMGLPDSAFHLHPAYRVAYENGWGKGWEEKKKNVS